MDKQPYRINKATNRKGKPTVWFYVLAGIVLAALFLGKPLLHFWVESLWFNEVGYQTVFWTIVRLKWILGLLGGLVIGGLTLGNLRIARRLSPPPRIPDDLRGRVEAATRTVLMPALAILALFVALVGGIATSERWEKLLFFLNPVSFGMKDPLFGRDIGYYVCTLPFQQFVVRTLAVAVVVSLLAALAVYIADRAPEIQGRFPKFAAGPIAHLNILAALAFALKGLDYWLRRYDLLHSEMGVITGAGYADVHARLPVLIALSVICLVFTVLCVLQAFRNRLTLAPAGVVVVLAVSLFAGSMYPSFVQRFQVKPNEFQKEESFIRHAIAFTRYGFGLDKLKVADFPIKPDYSVDLIRRNSETVANARLWDYNVAAQAYGQLQAIKPYYQFNNVDVDRYTINGRYRQTLIAAREMNQDGLPDQAKTWQNRRLVFTHGYGLCMSAVNEVSRDGQPTFLVKDFPPTGPTDLKVTQPRIYFGESEDDWVIVKTATDEFDYPSPAGDQYHRYEGKAGIAMGGFLKRLALSTELNDINITLSNLIKPDSRLLLHRRLQERVSKVLPFLLLDRDPYPVLADGRLVWLVDAYTATNRIPYSESYGRLRPINYIRNSVKISVDAYDGTITAYVSDDEDPLLKVYYRAFPGVFKPFSEMPRTLVDHRRYPEDLFNIQSSVYLHYHMTDPRIFFTKEDAWSVPVSARGKIGEVNSEAMEAFYVIMRLPGERTQQMMMMRPFTPRQRNNMVAWMAARCDGDDYGKLVVYRFPIDNLPFGPSQVDASVMQKPEISKEMTLLNSSNSQVVLGNLLTIPMEQSILYVQPLYLQSQNRGNRRAELTRVIVAYGDRLEMGESLQDALGKVFGEGAGSPAGGEPAAVTAARPTTKALVRRAADSLKRAQAAQRAGDWAGYGAAIKDVEKTISQLDQLNQ
jgi:uncharacterized membrane protein (UPF0182 family)